MSEPTDCVPGSAGKIAVLAERAAAELPLFHPLDRTFDGVSALLLFPDGIPCHAEPAACRRARRSVAFHHGDGHRGEATAASGPRVVRCHCQVPEGVLRVRDL